MIKLICMLLLSAFLFAVLCLATFVRLEMQKVGPATEWYKFASVGVMLTLLSVVSDYFVLRIAIANLAKLKHVWVAIASMLALSSLLVGYLFVRNIDFSLCV